MIPTRISYIATPEVSADTSLHVTVGPSTHLIPRNVLLYYSKKYGSNFDELSRVIKCESSWNVTAVGDNGDAYSLLQFHKPTFDRFSQELGEELDYYSWHDQIKLGAWAFAQGEKYKRHWSCYTRQN